MLRLCLLLIAVMVAALMTLGQDKGQLRPGLAQAKAEGRLEEVWAEAEAKAAAREARRRLAPVTVAAEAEEVSAPVVAEAPALPAAAPILPDTVVEPVREVVAVVPEPIFSLEAYGNEAKPGLDGTEVDALAAAEPAPIADDTAALLAAEEGAVWFVSAESVNVRAGPSTDAEVLTKLALGEATLVVQTVDAEWTRIVIQGDGVEGFVATRFLSPNAP